jgi:hypothetical protein
MVKNTKHPGWKKAQPHSAKTGRIVTKNYAEANPNKVEWVTAKKRGK